jgi:penicillin-binding protein 1C
MHTIKKLLFMTVVGCLVVGIGLYAIPLPGRITATLSPVVYSAEGALLRAYLNQEDKWRFPVELDDLPPFFVDGLLCLEDKRFFSHPGIDPLALVRAVRQNLYAGKVVSGGSTITMQVVRLLEPRPRTILAKIVEALRAIQLEWWLTKEDILKLYVTYAPYGGNVEGIAAASYVYFGHGPSSLTQAEAAFLYLLPQAPARWQTYTQHMWKEARQHVLDRLKRCGLLTSEDMRQAQEAPLPTVRQRFPLHAAHFADYLRSMHPARFGFQTTILIDVQRFLERLVRRLHGALQGKGIHNIAILVVENVPRAVRGVIGNFDYLATDHGQKIASFAVPRSPGSTLKPFLYALALDQAMLLPETLLLDVPTRFKRYAPANFSGTYRGLVPAETALSQSLNVPFVRLLQRLGTDYFLSFLELGGLHVATDRRDLGLSMIIGGVEITPLEMVKLYVNLANSGARGDLRLLSSSDTAHGHSPWLSRGAVYLTDQALQKRDRPDFPQRKDITVHDLEIRWKTGTSQGRRDAWSIGYDKRFTVLVWLGNLDHRPSVALTGADSAAPVMFEILEALRAHARPNVFQSRHPMLELDEVEVCAFSGDRASPFCPVTRPAWGVRDRVPVRTCRFHKRILRDITSGMRVVKGCDRGVRAKLVTVLDLPTSVLTLMRTMLRDQELLPPFHPQCTYVPVVGGTLNIRSPVHGGRYLLLPSFGQRTVNVPLELHASGPSEDVSCILNGKQLAFGSMEFDRVLRLVSGRYHLFCSNMDGASDEVHFEVAGPSTLPRLYR